jgi:hypothetical protein
MNFCLFFNDMQIFNYGFMIFHKDDGIAMLNFSKLI